MKRVCIVGSIDKAGDLMHKLDEKFTLEGIKCYIPHMYRHDIIEVITNNQKNPGKYFKGNLSREEERIGSRMHAYFVGISDLIYVVNPKGYIGTSTAGEIVLATATRKKVYSTEPIDDPNLEIFSGHPTRPNANVVSPEELIKIIKNEE